MTDGTEGAPSEATAQVEQTGAKRRRRLLRVVTGIFALCVAIAASYAAHRAQQGTASSAEPTASARARLGATETPARTSPSAAQKRYAVQGPSTKANPFVARQEALKEKIEFGMIGALNTHPDAGHR